MLFQSLMVVKILNFFEPVFLSSNGVSTTYFKSDILNISEPVWPGFWPDTRHTCKVAPDTYQLNVNQDYFMELL